METAGTALLTDLYQLTMCQAYLEHGMRDTAVFEFFVRKLPAKRNFLVAAGLEQVLQFLEELHFSNEDLKWLSETGRFESKFIYALRDLRFSGDVDAMPEGTIFFANEPILRVRAPLPEAQLVETRIINLLHFQTLIASKAARCVMATPGKDLVEFGLRRAHGREAGVLGARATYISGFTATSNVLAGREFGIPVSGTMAHSFVQAYDDEGRAFFDFATANTDVVLLIDTYNTEEAAAKVARIAPQLRSQGIDVRGVRLDSGDLVDHARKVRHILDSAGLGDIKIFASGSIDEYELHKFEEVDAPIDGYGIGTRLSTSADAPYLDCAYKLQEYAGKPRLKRSEGKETWPGPKQVYRVYDAAGLIGNDLVTLESDVQPGEPLLMPVMRKGIRLPQPTISEIRDRVQCQIRCLPGQLRSLQQAEPFAVTISDQVRKLAAKFV